MQLITDRIITRSITLEEAAAKARQAKTAPPLDEILAGIDASNKLVKTAAAAAKQQKAASVEETATEPVAETRFQPLPFPKSAVEAPKTVEAKNGSKFLKVAKSLDFRAWDAQAVSKAWDSHGGDLKKCVASVQGKASNPEAYCCLLKEASSMANEKLTKIASAKAAVKTDEKASIKTAGYVKISKLSDEQKSFFKEFWTPIYGTSYVEAMLSDD